MNWRSEPRQILVQIQQTAVQSQRALNISVQQTAAKERERKILQLTIKEISSMGEDVHLYKGVGKMCRNIGRLSTIDPNMTHSRFMMEPHKAMVNDLKSQEKELTDDINSLNKKVRRDYFLDKKKSTYTNMF